VSDFKKMRIEYINNWPISEKFPFEKEYEDLINNFEKEKKLFSPMLYSYSTDREYNIAISFLIDALDMLPNYPNFAFEFVFKAVDIYSEKLYATIPQLTQRLQNLVDCEMTILSSNTDFLKVVEKLFKEIPNSTCQYLYARLLDEYDESKAIYDQSGKCKQIIGRLVKRGNDVNQYSNLAKILEYACKKYKYDPDNYSGSIRKGSRFIFNVFTKEEINIDGGIVKVNSSDKLNLWINGILFTMRNDRAHGDGISSFKSSLTSLKTYAHNYFCFLSVYIFLSAMLEPTKVVNEETLSNFTNNIESYSLLFGKKVINE
jgi:tetratricopeptide (TPR) repeat protein